MVWRGDTCQLNGKECGSLVCQLDPVILCANSWRQVSGARSQDLLFHRIPLMDTQACWLLLLMCAATRANFWLHAVHPDQSESFAVRHDTNVWRCMRAVLGVEGVSGTVQEVLQLPFSLKSLTSGVRSRVAAFWSSWADCIHMIKQRHPEIAQDLPHVLRQ